jgi:hypothetical protein
MTPIKYQKQMADTIIIIMSHKNENFIAKHPTNTNRSKKKKEIKSSL